MEFLSRAFSLISSSLETCSIPASFPHPNPGILRRSLVKFTPPLSTPAASGNDAFYLGFFFAFNQITSRVSRFFVEDSLAEPDVSFLGAFSFFDSTYFSPGAKWTAFLHFRTG